MSVDSKSDNWLKNFFATIFSAVAFSFKANEMKNLSLSIIFVF